MSETGLDWPGLLAAGLRDLKLKPWEFWALTPWELQVMLGLERRVAPLAFSDFDSLMVTFPDAKRPEHTGDE